MTHSKTKQIDIICKLDAGYEDKREELNNLTMLDILNIKMEIKKNLKNKSVESPSCEDDSWALVNRVGCEN
jgi:hypothetical protein